MFFACLLGRNDERLAAVSVCLPVAIVLRSDARKHSLVPLIDDANLLPTILAITLITPTALLVRALITHASRIVPRRTPLCALLRLHRVRVHESSRHSMYFIDLFCLTLLRRAIQFFFFFSIALFLLLAVVFSV